MRASRLLVLGVIIGAVAWSHAAAADILPDGASGWHTWQVDEPASTEMCCYSWKRGTESSSGCNLDGSHVSFSSNGDCKSAPGSVQVFVLLKNGAPDDIRVLSSNCPVTAASAITDHGLVTSEENIDWFRTFIEDKDASQDVREEALFALVLSGSDAAFTYLDRLLTSR